MGMGRLTRQEFERLVTQAVQSLPPAFLDRLENVDVVVEAVPTAEDLEYAGVEPGGTLLGLYHGIPQSERGSWYGNVLPDRIVIYQRPIEDIARTRREIREEVRLTLMHEIGHHFGLNEDELSEAGYE
jgi:predicted Zn-dependent protease with MMP-like domain